VVAAVVAAVEVEVAEVGAEVVGAEAEAAKLDLLQILHRQLHRHYRRLNPLPIKPPSSTTLSQIFFS
jgi:hypothetical protein